MSPTQAARRRALFLGSGRGWAASAMGLVAARQAFEFGLGTIPEPPFEVRVSEVAPLNRIQRLAVSPVPHLKNTQDLRALRYGVVRSAGARWAFEQELRRTGADAAIISTAQIALTMGRLSRRLPYLLTCDVPILDWSMMQRGLAVGLPEPPDLRLFAALERRAFRDAPVCVAWTSHVADRIEAIAPGTRTEVIHPGVDLERFRPRPAARVDGPVRVLFVGGRWKAKGGPEVTNALRERLGRDVELHVVSPHTPAGLGIVSHGATMTPELFRKADLFCMPTRLDGAPLAIAEAQACGLPVVSTTVSSIPSMVGKDRGRVVGVGDADALRAALYEVIDDQSLRADMSAAARSWAEDHYDVRRNTSRLLDCLAAVADGRPVFP